MTSNTLRITVICLTICIITSAAAFAIGRSTEHTEIDEDCQKRTGLTSPELDCVAQERYEKLSSLEKKVGDYSKEMQIKGQSKRVSVFFRDLESKKWFGINDNELFSPASLLKIPLAIAYLKYSEIDPNIMRNGLVYDPGKYGELNTMQHYPPPNNLEIGKTYPINELIQRMIVYSDNDAVHPLFHNISTEFYTKVLTDLGLHIDTDNNSSMNLVSVRTQAAIFRQLYNASYLNRSQSEYLLNTMTATTFDKGLKAGIPAGVTIAHKFGESTQRTPDLKQLVSVELHDCGIIYKDDPPYILCVMTEGPSYESQEKIIADISKIVYDNL
jgi:beta-lactamase class A